MRQAPREPMTVTANPFPGVTEPTAVNSPTPRHVAERSSLGVVTETSAGRPGCCGLFNR